MYSLSNYLGKVCKSEDNMPPHSIISPCNSIIIESLIVVMAVAFSHTQVHAASENYPSHIISVVSQGGKSIYGYSYQTTATLGQPTLNISQYANHKLSSGFWQATAPSSQSINFGSIANKTYADSPFGVSATATSGLTVSFSGQSNSICSVTDHADGTASVAYVAAGLCTVRASQAGNNVYSAAADVDQSFTFSKSGQTIVFGSNPGPVIYTLGDKFQVSATGGASGNSVSYSSLSTGVCTASSSTVTMVSVGNCVIAANQAGNAYYNAASQVTQTISIVVPPSSGTSLPPSSGNPPSGGGSINVTGSVPGTNPAFSKFQFIPVEGHPDSPPSGTAPAGKTFPFGLFDFTVTGLAPGGTLSLNIVYPRALAAGAEYWKYGPTPTNAAPHWYQMPVVISPDRLTVTLTITDGGLGDDDLLANGTIVDQGGPTEPSGGNASQPVPTLSRIGVAILAGWLLLIGIAARRKRAL